MSRESYKRKHTGNQKDNMSVRIVQDTDKQEEHWRISDQEC